MVVLCNMGWLGEYKMSENNPKRAAVNAHQEPTCGSYNSRMTSSYQEVLSAPLRALNYKEKWTRPGWNTISWPICNQLSGNSLRRCNALLPWAKFSIHSGCLIVHLFEVGVIPCMQLPPLAVAVYVLKKHGLHMLLLSNWEILPLPHHYSIHEDGINFSVQCSHKPIVQFLSYRWMHHIYGCTYKRGAGLLRWQEWCREGAFDDVIQRKRTSDKVNWQSIYYKE